MMSLKERLGKLPAHKAMEFVTMFFTEYNELQKQIKIRPTIAKFGEYEYVKFLNKKMTPDEMQKELHKMVPRTMYGVFKVMMEEAQELQLIAKVMT